MPITMPVGVPVGICLSQCVPVFRHACRYAYQVGTPGNIPVGICLYACHNACHYVGMPVGMCLSQYLPTCRHACRYACRYAGRYVGMPVGTVGRYTCRYMPVGRCPSVYAYRHVGCRLSVYLSVMSMLYAGHALSPGGWMTCGRLAGWSGASASLGGVGKGGKFSHISRTGVFFFFTRGSA